MYTDTVTLFNRVPGGRGEPDTWYPTVIKGVNLNIDRAALIAKYGAESQDAAALHIRYTRNGDRISVADKTWMPPKSWNGESDTLTFKGGALFDFFWAGEWHGGIVTDEEYGDEGFYNYMNRTHDYVFAISAVAQYSIIPHFEIMGK